MKLMILLLNCIFDRMHVCFEENINQEMLKTPNSFVGRFFGFRHMKELGIVHMKSFYRVIFLNKSCNNVSV